MSHDTRASSASRPATIACMTHALGRSWTRARLTDHELMALPANLSRHSG